MAIDRKHLARRLANHFISFVAKEIVLRIATPIYFRQLIQVERVSIGVAMIDSGYCAESSPVVNNTHANFLKCCHYAHESFRICDGERKIKLTPHQQAVTKVRVTTSALSKMRGARHD